MSLNDKTAAAMFQEFRTHAYSITALFYIWVYVYALFFSKALLDASVITVQRFDFNNCIIAIKLYLMILNLCLTSE